MQLVTQEVAKAGQTTLCVIPMSDIRGALPAALGDAGGLGQSALRQRRWEHGFAQADAASQKTQEVCDGADSC